MKNYNKSYLSSLLLGSLALGATGLSAHVNAVEIENSGFENNWDGWADTDPSAISSDSYSGNRSAKITGSSGAFEQVVTVTENTNYQLQAFIKGSGAIGAIVGGTTYANSGSSNDFEAVTVSFNSGSATQVTLFGQYSSGEGRFDDFSLTQSSEPTDPGDGGETTPPTGGECSSTGDLVIVGAYDDGSNDGHGPNNTIDGDLGSESRWSSNGSGKQIIFDLGAEATVNAAQIVWFKGNSRVSYFDIDTSLDNNNWDSVIVSGQSSGSSSSYETVDGFNAQARYLRITGYGNSSNTWNSIIEAKILGCDQGDIDGGTNPPVDPPTPPPTTGIDLSDWYLGVPVDNNGDGKSDSISESELVAGYEHPEWFYYAADGGLVFKAPIDAPKTSTNTSYTRSELREMLRRGDESIATQGINKNNWVFTTYSSEDRSNAGGIDGELVSTLKVDHVTTTGDSGQVGRVIVGQIHARNDEPAKLYYRKLPGNILGSIYLAHEPNGGNDQKYDMIGSNSSSASNPSDGIALGEVFSYSIKVVGHDLTVTIMRDGKPDVVQKVDMSNSGYHNGSDEYNYFKAGVYNQNNTGDADDYVQATFYSIVNTHDGYNH
ncbi:polysaccharide lyase family 7 protein [Thalassotalea litorea]|uniref:polysaccharide lyase family 7 protein n=1 Tax=Thalassotalea litorea TaxID=2020715 RepID=UPI003735C1FB